MGVIKNGKNLWEYPFLCDLDSIMRVKMEDRSRCKQYFRITNKEQDQGIHQATGEAGLPQGNLLAPKNIALDHQKNLALHMDLVEKTLLLVEKTVPTLDSQQADINKDLDLVMN